MIDISVDNDKIDVSITIQITQSNKIGIIIAYKNRHLRLKHSISVSKKQSNVTNIHVNNSKISKIVIV